MHDAFVIAQPFGDAFGAALSAAEPRIRIMPQSAERPWEAAAEADMLLALPSPVWGAARQDPAPAGWPGRLRWFYSASTGIDAYPRWIFDVPLVTCGRGLAAEEIAEYVIAAIFARTKDLAGVRAHGPADWQRLMPGQVAGSTVGILGMGSIGTAVARKAKALGMQVVAMRRRAALGGEQSAGLVDTLDALMSAADHLVLALPSTPETRGMVDARALAAAKPGLHLINVSRGEVLDQEALIAALDEGRIGFATLDVTSPEPLPDGHPLWTHPGVFLTPHIAANSRQGLQKLVDKIVDDVRRVLDGGEPGDIVDAAAGY